MATDRELAIGEDPAELARLAADFVLSCLERALSRRQQATWVLAGGSTPLALYSELASRPDEIDWRRVRFYWGDERAVPPETPQSNFGAARRVLLDPLGIAPEQWRRIRGESAPEEAAEAYDLVVDEALAAGPWDLVTLGLGEDGHTASLFPPRLDESPAASWILPTTAPVAPQGRVSMSVRALSRARRVMVLASGVAKAAAVRRAVGGDPSLHIAAVEALDGPVVFYLDQAAAQSLPATVESSTGSRN